MIVRFDFAIINIWWRCATWIKTSLGPTPWAATTLLTPSPIVTTTPPVMSLYTLSICGVLWRRYSSSPKKSINYSAIRNATSPTARKQSSVRRPRSFKRYNTWSAKSRTILTTLKYPYWPSLTVSTRATCSGMLPWRRKSSRSRRWRRKLRLI